MKISYKIPTVLLILIMLSGSLFYCKPKEKIAETKAPEPKVNLVKPDTIIEEKPSQEYFIEEYFRTDDHIYKDNIRTVLFHRLGWELSTPLMEFGSGDRLLLSFDDLEADVKNYRYRIIHCDAGWQKSDLSDFEFLDGFNEDYIDDYLPSYNTMQSYTHYWLEFPSEDLKPKISGNYIIIVYEDGSPDNPFITKRFAIFEQRVNIKARILGATLLDDRKYKQEIDFEINIRGYEIDNIYNDFQVIILQNGRWDNAISDLKPVVIKGDLLDYNHDFGNTFDGGNEYRYFDIKSFKYNSERVKKHSFSVQRVYESFLWPDERRPFKVHTQLDDLNGQFYIKTEDGEDSRVEGEYTWVHFYLPYDFPLVDGNLYVFGALTQWQFSKEGKMIYDYNNSRYMARMYLKQGYYNYQYAFLRDGKKNADETMVEGNHYETDNDYTIMVYNRERGSRYDKLIGLGQFNSLVDR